MAKPIFIAGFPIAADYTALSQVAEDLNYKLGEDYHVLTYRTSKVDDVTFTVLNAVNASDAEISELIERTREEINLLLTEKALINSTIHNLIPKNND